MRVAEWICSSIGIVDDTVDESEIEGDGYIRTRVTIDISKPLSHGRLVSLENDKELWVSFKYERLPNLCY